MRPAAATLGLSSWPQEKRKHNRTAKYKLGWADSPRTLEFHFRSRHGKFILDPEALRTTGTRGFYPHKNFNRKRL